MNTLIQQKKMDPTELKTRLLGQREELVSNLHRIEGAIAACTELEAQEEVAVEEED